MFMAGTGSGGYGPGQGPGSSNPRKFSEKIALLTQRQAEDTAAFQEVMMDITSTRIQVQRAQQARSLGPYYGGSLPNVNQIGRNPSDHQGAPPSCGHTTRRHPMADREQGDGPLSFPIRPNRRHADSAPYRPAPAPPAPEASWRWNWTSSSQSDAGQNIHPSTTALNRTNSDSALHTSVKRTSQSGELLSPTHSLSSRAKHRMFPYPVPPIEENVLEEGKQPCSSRKSPALCIGHSKTRELPGISLLVSPEQPPSLLDIPAVFSTSGSLPDLSSLHLPSPQPGGSLLDSDPLGTACSTGNLPGRPSELGELVVREEPFHLPGLSVSLQGSLSHPLLPSSMSHNIQSSLSSHSLPSSLSSASLHLSLSNPSLQSCPSNQSLQSFLSSSSLSGQSLQSAASHCSYSSGIGGSRSCSSSSLSGSPRPIGQSLSRRRTPLSPLVVPPGGEARWHQAKQFSPVGSPTLSSITQGVLLDTSSQGSKDQSPANPPCSQPSQLPAPGPGPGAVLPHQQLSLREGQLQQAGLETHTLAALHQQGQQQQQHQLPQKHNLHQQHHYQQHYHQQQQQHQQHQQHQEHHQQQLHQQQQHQQQHQQHQEHHQQQQQHHQQQHHQQQQQEQHQQQQHQRQTQVCPYQQVQTDRQDLSNLQQQHTHHQRLYLQQQQQQQQQHLQQAQAQSYQHFHQRPQQHVQPGPHLQHPPAPLYQWHQPAQTPEALQPRQIQHGAQFPQKQHSDQGQWGDQRPYPLFQGADLRRLQNAPASKQGSKDSNLEAGRSKSQAQGRVWPQQRAPGLKNRPQAAAGFPQSSSVLDPVQQGYVGLHLTPSQTEALSQQLGQLSKEPPWAEQCLPDSGSQSGSEKDRFCSREAGSQTPQQDQNHFSAEFHNLNMTPYQDLPGALPSLDFQEDPFSLDPPLDLEELNMLSGGHVVEELLPA